MAHRRLQGSSTEGDFSTLPQKNAISGEIRCDWSLPEVMALFRLPLPELLRRAHRIHCRHFDPREVQLCVLLSIKTGGCPEDCAYCPQSARYRTGVRPTPLLDLKEVRARALQARAQGASRFCMGAAWRGPRPRDLPPVLEMIAAVKDLGLETCATLGLLDAGQARLLKDAGLDFYNHNIDTSPGFYRKVVGTRSYGDRLRTLAHVRQAGMAVCCGGIVGMGESVADRAEMLQVLATLPQHPESVPINLLHRSPGTPLADAAPADPLDLVRAVSVARIVMPASRVRLAAGRNELSDEFHALCFHAGANSIFYGERLLTTRNSAVARDRRLLQRLGMVVSH